MPILPSIKPRPQKRDVTDCFRGYDHRTKIRKGHFYDMENLSSRCWPMLSCREKRGMWKKMEEPQGMLAKEELAWAAGGKLYYGGEETALTLSRGEKQLVSMGAYICIFPDKLFYNTADLKDYGSMEARYSSAGAVTATLCKLDGTEYQSPRVADTPEAEPKDGALWIDSSGETDSLKQWSAQQGIWTEMTAVYTRLRFSSQGELPELFKVLDGVKISGCQQDELNGYKLIQAIGGAEGEPDYIVIPGLIRKGFVQDKGSISIERLVPDMDFVCQSQNRLWGCRYGNDGEQNINEIYGSALGDFKNWSKYQGLSTDSWAASVGSDGPWTGAVNYLGSPVFFKEDRIHKVSVSASGAHRVNETVCRGVQPGSHKSLTVVNETLYYKATKQVCAWQGGFPVSVSEALGDERYFQAVGGSIGDRYFLSMKDQNEKSHIFVYDIARAAWMKEDGLDVMQFQRLDERLYAMTQREIWVMDGSLGEKEPFVDWMAESGILYYQYPDKKYVSRFVLRLSMEPGAWMDLYIQYDSSGNWESKGRVRLSGTGTVTVPICPRRCDHMQLRLVGRGDIKLFSMAKILEIGSDM